MKAVILAAGKGTRMRNLTAECPKPMLKVHGKPILQHIIDGLKHNGIKEFCIITGWHAEVIEDYFGDGATQQIRVTYIRQTSQDGTGKATELAKDFVGNDNFLLTYGDILVKEHTYTEMVQRFESANSDGVITGTPGEDVRKGGCLFFDRDFNLIRLVEKPSDEQLAALKAEGLLKENSEIYYNSGIYIFTPKLFEFTVKLEKSPRGEYELTDAIIQYYKNGLKLSGLKIADRWVDVRDPEVLASLEAKTI